MKRCNIIGRKRQNAYTFTDPYEDIYPTKCSVSELFWWIGVDKMIVNNL